MLLVASGTGDPSCGLVGLLGLLFFLPRLRWRNLGIFLFRPPSMVSRLLVCAWGEVFSSDRTSHMHSRLISYSFEDWPRPEFQWLCHRRVHKCLHVLPSYLCLYFTEPIKTFFYIISSYEANKSAPNSFLRCPLHDHRNGYPKMYSRNQLSIHWALSSFSMYYISLHTHL